MAQPVGRSIAQRAALVLLLAGSAGHAEPEGYMGGEGRPVGSSYMSGGMSITVRGIAVDAVRSGSTWSCGGVAVEATRSGNLVTVSLGIANPSDESLSTQLATMDLVVVPGSAGNPVQVLEGACVREGHAEVSDVSLGAHRRTTFLVQFLAPRRTVPKVLVYNDDDFAALFALPAPKPARGSAKVH